ncbi:MAG: cation:proton antiporter [Pseudomonadales bacterium]|nr:cation:proton antiporter [Pseudomonadales bacterium]
MHDAIFHSFFLIFCGAAAIATLALYGKQPLLVAYVALGVLLGPSGLKLTEDVALITDIAHIGIIFLLFLLGLDMQPGALLRVFRRITHVVVISSLIFAASAWAIAFGFGFTTTEALVIGAAMMFSSTIIGIKLLPVTVLHHRAGGELMIGMLLLQDFLAIVVLLVLAGSNLAEFDGLSILRALAALPLLVICALLAVHHVILKLFERYERMGEYMFLLSIGWCLGIAEFAHQLGLSREIGAFIAGISIATHPISQHLALSLKPLRDFFLILFFFTIGARFDLAVLHEIALPTLALGGAMLLLKPVTFRLLFLGQAQVGRQLSWDLGFRLGQCSEFSLLVAYLAATTGLIGNAASHLVQAATILTFLVSSYVIVLNFPNPIAVRDHLRRD